MSDNADVAVDATPTQPNELPSGPAPKVSEFDGGRREGATTSIDDIIGDVEDDVINDIEDDIDDDIIEDDIIDDDIIEDDIDDEDDIDEDDIDEDDIDEDDASEGPTAEELLDYTVRAKVNGEEIDVSVQELVDNYQLGQAAREKFTQAAQMRKQSEQFITILKDPNNVFNVLEQLGHNVEELAEGFIVDRIKYHSMSDSEKRALDAERKYEMLTRKQKELEDQQRQAQLAQQAKEYEGQLQADITEALEAVGLVKNKRVFAKVANIMADALKNDMRLSATQAARIAKKEIQEELSGFLSETDEATLEQIVGDKQKTVVKKATKARNKKIIRKKKKNPMETGATVADRVAKRAKIDPSDPDAFSKLFRNL